MCSRPERRSSCSRGTRKCRSPWGRPAGVPTPDGRHRSHGRQSLPARTICRPTSAQTGSAQFTVRHPAECAGPAVPTAVRVVSRMETSTIGFSAMPSCVSAAERSRPRAVFSRPTSARSSRPLRECASRTITFQPSDGGTCQSQAQRHPVIAAGREQTAEFAEAHPCQPGRGPHAHPPSSAVRRIATWGESLSAAWIPRPTREDLACGPRRAGVVSAFRHVHASTHRIRKVVDRRSRTTL